MAEIYEIVENPNQPIERYDIYKWWDESKRTASILRSYPTRDQAEWFLKHLPKPEWDSNDPSVSILAYLREALDQHVNDMISNVNWKSMKEHEAQAFIDQLAEEVDYATEELSRDHGYHAMLMDVVGDDVEFADSHLQIHFSDDYKWWLHDTQADEFYGPYESEKATEEAKAKFL